jgi:hypothetical protein
MEFKLHDRCWLTRGGERRPVSVFYLDEESNRIYVYDTLSGWGGYVNPDSLTFREDDY